jgi:ABC-type transport system involved in cytochrome c biogenesis permease component
LDDGEQSREQGSFDVLIFMVALTSSTSTRRVCLAVVSFPLLVVFGLMAMAYSASSVSFGKKNNYGLLIWIHFGVSN